MAVASIQRKDSLLHQAQQQWTRFEKDLQQKLTSVLHEKDALSSVRASCGDLYRSRVPRDDGWHAPNMFGTPMTSRLHTLTSFSKIPIVPLHLTVENRQFIHASSSGAFTFIFVIVAIIEPIFSFCVFVITACLQVGRSAENCPTGSPEGATGSRGCHVAIRPKSRNP